MRAHRASTGRRPRKRCRRRARRTLNYFAFQPADPARRSLEAKQNWKGAELSLAAYCHWQLPLQLEASWLQLAADFPERSDQLAKVFASDSPISAEQVRCPAAQRRQA